MTHEQWKVSVAIASWKNIVGLADKVFSILTEEQFLQEVASISAGALTRLVAQLSQGARKKLRQDDLFSNFTNKEKIR